MSEHDQPSGQAMMAAEALRDHSFLTYESDAFCNRVAAIIERETGAGVAEVMIETADNIIRRLLQNPHDPETQAAAGRWRAAFILRTKPTN